MRSVLLGLLMACFLISSPTSAELEAGLDVDLDCPDSRQVGQPLTAIVHLETDECVSDGQTCTCTAMNFSRVIVTLIGSEGGAIGSAASSIKIFGPFVRNKSCTVPSASPGDAQWCYPGVTPGVLEFPLLLIAQMPDLAGTVAQFLVSVESFLPGAGPGLGPIPLDAEVDTGTCQVGVLSGP